MSASTRQGGLVRVCSADDVPLGEGRALTLAGRRIALFHAEGGWYAIDGDCPHKGGPLADGILADRSVICPLHERRFDLETGEALTDGCGVGTHRIELREGHVFIELAMQPRRAA